MESNAYAKTRLTAFYSLVKSSIKQTNSLIDVYQVKTLSGWRRQLGRSLRTRLVSDVRRMPLICHQQHLL